jgi:hypothetical protein
LTSAKLAKMMAPMRVKQVAEAEREEAWIKYAKAIEPHVEGGLAKSIRRDLSDRETLKELKAKFFGKDPSRFIPSLEILNSTLS